MTADWSELELLEFYRVVNCLATSNEVLLRERREFVASLRVKLEQFGWLNEAGELNEAGKARFEQLLRDWADGSTQVRRVFALDHG